MNTTKGFSLYQIQNFYYLLPFGQNITFFRKGIQLNETGVLLWKAMERGMSKPELFSYIVDYYQVSEADYPSIKYDIEQFLQQLEAAHLIYDDSEPLEITRHLKIGALVIDYQGPEELLHPNLLSFQCDAVSAGQYWNIFFTQNAPALQGELIIKNHELEIIKCNKAYTILFTDNSQLTHMTVSLDGTKACFYCKAPYNINCLREQLFHAFRYAYLIYAQRFGVFALHSSSILYKNKIWLFSASSGTGKSTQADFWNNLYQTPIINGDLNLIHLSCDEPIVTGLPWCGTSGIYSNGSYPLGGIILLKQGHENTIQQLSKDKQQLSVAARLISPTWTSQLLGYNLSFAQRLIEHIPVFRYICRKEPEAARQLHRYIDELMLKDTVK
jgi:hypothetical protein